jgi:hypothetical protein
MVRKYKNGAAVEFDPVQAEPRLTLNHFSYINIEESVSAKFPRESKSKKTKNKTQ